MVILTSPGRVLQRLPDSIAIIGMHRRKAVFQLDLSGSRQSQENTACFRAPELIFADVPLPQSEFGRGHRQTHPFLAFAQSLFLVYRFGDVHTRSNVTSKNFFGVVTRHAVILEPAIFAIVTSEAVLHNKRRACVEGRGVSLKASLQIIWMHTFGPAISHFLLHRATGKLEPRFVEEITKFVHARHPDEHGRSVGDRAKTLFTLTQLFFRYFALGDIARYPAREGWFAAFV